MNAKWFRCPPDEWLRHILEIHFHPDQGARYWIDRAREKGIVISRDIKTVDDMIAFGPMDENALASRPVEDFIPQCFHGEKKHFILGDTAGTTGNPKVTAFRDDEFYQIFVDFFGYVAESLSFPKQINWLWVGPSGPHIIGKAARMLPPRMDSMDAFAVDFDPRWIKKLSPGSLGWERYFQHIEDQALRILNTQEISILFSTPPVIERLAQKMGADLRRRIKGVHYGGLALEPALYKRLQAELFPEAVHISGYGNTLFGVCLEVEPQEKGNLHYFSPGARLIIRLVRPGDNGPETSAQAKRLGQTVSYAERGQVVFSRLDESFLILNMFERDTAVRIPPSAKALKLGLHLDGFADPRPLTDINQGRKTSLGLY